MIRMPTSRVRMRRFVPSSRLATIGRVPAVFTACHALPRDCPASNPGMHVPRPGQDDTVRISHRGLARDLGWLPEGDDDDAKH
jgi:hypothetical protein